VFQRKRSGLTTRGYKGEVLQRERESMQSCGIGEDNMNEFVKIKESLDNIGYMNKKKVVEGYIIVKKNGHRGRY